MASRKPQKAKFVSPHRPQPTDDREGVWTRERLEQMDRRFCSALAASLNGGGPKPGAPDPEKRAPPLPGGPNPQAGTTSDMTNVEILLTFLHRFEHGER